MRCAETLTALATGGPWPRWRAARHIARCPACSAAADDFRRLVEALGDVPPLTASRRQSWLEAADEAPPSTRRPAGRRLAIAATVLGLGVGGAWLATRPTRPGATPVLAELDASVVKRATLRELDVLRGDAASLARELDRLLVEVELLDARREIDALQLRFASNDRP